MSVTCAAIKNENIYALLSSISIESTLAHCTVDKHALLHYGCVAYCVSALVTALCFEKKTHRFAYYIFSFGIVVVHSDLCASGAAERCMSVHFGSGMAVSSRRG